MLCRCLLSAGMFFSKGANAVVRNIEERIARATHLPVENGEGMQVLKYHHGQQYAPHHVSFLPYPPLTWCRNPCVTVQDSPQCMRIGLPICHSDPLNCATLQRGGNFAVHTNEMVFGIEACEIRFVRSRTRIHICSCRMINRVPS